MSYSTRSSVRGQRRSRHCHRHVVRRIALAFALLVMLASAAWRSIPGRFSYSSFSRANSQNSLWLQGSARENLALLAGQSGTQPQLPESGRVVYRYSVVPGGVQGPDELERASVRDQVVSTHFAGFDFHRAIVVRLNRPKLVYLSYRVGDHVFWTKEKVQLAKGEKIISDGKIAARTRCGNQVSEKARKAISPQEPPTAVFDQPMHVGGGTGTQVPFPSDFESALLTRPQFPVLDPAAAGPPRSGLFFIPPGGGFFPPVFPPAIPSGGCETAADEKREQQLGIKDDEKKEKHCSSPTPFPGPPPATVPEPGTILLVSSGLAGVYLRYRRKSAKRWG